MVGKTSTRRSTVRSKRWRRGAPDSSTRSACSTATRSATRQSPATWRGRYPDLQVAGAGYRVPDCARHLHDPGGTPVRIAFYVDLFKKVRETPEWKKLMPDGAFNQTFMSGADYAKWVDDRKAPRDLMKDAGFLASTN